MKIIDDDEDEDFTMDNFQVIMDIDGQIVEADCSVWGGTIANITLTHPYGGIFTNVRVEDEKGCFIDRDDAILYIEKTLRGLMLQIDFFKQHRKEYEAAYDAYNQLHTRLLNEVKRNYSTRCREQFQAVVKADKDAKALYEKHLTSLLIPIHPVLLRQILKAVPWRNISS